MFEEKQFIVCAECGHVGKSRMILINYPVYAKDGKEAAALVRWFPRVKHHHKYAIKSVKQVSQEEFEKAAKELKYDAYLHVDNIQDQRRLIGDLASRRLKENLCFEEDSDEESFEEKETAFYKIRREKLIYRCLLE